MRKSLIAVLILFGVLTITSEIEAQVKAEPVFVASPYPVTSTKIVVSGYIKPSPVFTFSPIPVGSSNYGIITPDPAKCQPNPCTVISLPKPVWELPKSMTPDNDAPKISSSPIPMPASFPLPTEPRLRSVTEVISKLEAVYNTNKIFLKPLDTSKCRQEGEQLICVAEEKLKYETEVEAQALFLGILPVKSKTAVTVDALSGEIVNETKPWYMKFTGFLFKTRN